MTRVLLVLLVALAASAPAAAYPWPVKPFDRQHPVRGFFGDPRTKYLNGILAGAFDGPAFLSFHQGVDISAPNGTPVYAVAGGTARYLGAETINLVTGRGVTFQYFHIVPIVGEGQQVVARRTVLGYVRRPWAHVHLTEIDGIRAVNPLARGHLTPYKDRTKPRVKDVIVRNQAGDVATPLGLCGRVELIAEAFDPQPMAVPGTENNLPVAPALVQWSMTKLGGTVVVPVRTAADFRREVPANGLFTNVFARGTYENGPRFGREQYPAMPGRYLFLLSPNYDTTRIPNGNYVIAVRVADTRGNTTTSTRRINVLNARKGVCPGSLPAPPTAEPPPTEPPSTQP